MSRSAFAIPKYYGASISPNQEPKNALEYLISVRHEAEAIPDVDAVEIVF